MAEPNLETGLLLMSETAVDRVLRLHPLTFLADGDDVVIGRVDIDSYGVFPPDGAALITCLGDGMALAGAADWYEQTYGEPVDLDGFLDALDELGFIDAAVDADPVTATESHTTPQPANADRLRWQRTGQALFSRPARLLFAALVGLAVAACVSRPSLLPHRDHVFFSHYLLVIEITVAVGQIPLILVHELFHLLAGRRLGLNARIRVSHRLYFVVFETVLDGLVIVPRAKRYLPMLAGMLADLLIVSLLTVVAWLAWTVEGPGSLVGGVCLALAFTTILRFALEFLLFLRTDVYYLIATLRGCVDLHGTSRDIVRNWLWRRLRRPARLKDPALWHPNDVRTARWYAPLYVAGYALAFGLFAFVLLPISWRFLDTAVTTVIHPNAGSGRFWDATGLLLLNVAQPAVAGLLKLRDRFQALRPAMHRSTRSATHSTDPSLAR
jgi:hypothetical protein